MMANGFPIASFRDPSMNARPTNNSAQRAAEWLEDKVGRQTAAPVYWSKIYYFLGTYPSGLG